MRDPDHACPQTREWKEGLVSVTFRDFSNNTSNKHQWIVLDGDIDAGGMPAAHWGCMSHLLAACSLSCCPRRQSNVYLTLLMCLMTHHDNCVLHYTHCVLL